MADRVEQVTEQTSINEDQVIRNRVVSTKDKNYSVAKVAQIIWFIVGVIVFLLIVRMVLALVGANPVNAFANLVYQLSNPFVAPFRGLLQVGTVELGVSRFELETLIAVMIYTLIGWGVVKMINLGRRETVL